MDDWLIDDDRLPIERKSILPGAGFFYPETVEATERERDVADRLEDAETVVVADTDADGLACVALIREAFGNAALVAASPHDLERALGWAAEYVEDGARVFVCDLCPDDPADSRALESLSLRANTVRWFDHHEWDPELKSLVEDADVSLTVGDSEEVCTADVALEAIDAPFDDRFHDLAAATRDHDLWIREDPRSDDLADLAHWIEPEEYVAIVREHGADLPADAQELLAERRIEKDTLVEKAIERAELREIGPWTVGVTYGRCSQNEVAEALRERGADAAVVVKPAGSASLRGTDNFERCHEVARQVNGGGHPKAAGCKPDIYDDMLDYAHHWTTRGAVAKQAIVNAFQRLDVEA